MTLMYLCIAHNIDDYLQAVFYIPFIPCLQLFQLYSLVFPESWYFYAVPCFKCLYNFGFCGAKIDYWHEEPCPEGASCCSSSIHFFLLITLDFLFFWIFYNLTGHFRIFWLTKWSSWCYWWSYSKSYYSSLCNPSHKVFILSELLGFKFSLGMPSLKHYPRILNTRMHVWQHILLEFIQ